MIRLRVMLMILGLAMAAFIGGCGGAEEPAEEIVVDTLESLDDGQFKAWKLDAGTYKVEMTASGDGASVKWVGSSCPGSEQTAEYSSICEMKQTGQFIIENPTAFGAGASTTVTLKITSTGG
jgi:hypothetical protein